MSCYTFDMTEELPKLERDGYLIRVGHIQEDYKHQSEGKYVDSHGEITTLGE